MANKLSLTELPALIARMVRPAPDPSAATDLVGICHRMALAYVRVKMMKSRFDPARLGLSVGDFAFDAIAELFRRDSSGRYTVFVSAFGDAPAGEPDAVEQRVRQLVFSAVNRQIYRSYRDTDPALAKLLRNIKLTLKSHPTAALALLGGEWAIVPRQATAINEGLPMYVPELFAAELHARASEPYDLRDILSGVAMILNEQADYRRAYPLTAAALVIRGVYARNLESEEAEILSDGMTDEELEQFLRPALGNVLRSTGRKYLENGKVTEHELQVYARALFDVVLGAVRNPDGEPGFLFDYVAKHDPTITYNDYLARHRAILEYLLKLVRRELQNLLKSEWNFPG